MYKPPSKTPDLLHLTHPHKTSSSHFFALIKRYITAAISLEHHCLLCAEPSRSRICRHCQELLVKPGYNCQQCALPLEHFALFCGQCLKQAPAFDSVFSPFLYRAPISALILDYKQKGHEYTGKGLSDLFCQSVSHHYQQQHLSLPSLITPVPLHWRSQWNRGFNQSACFSFALSQHMGIAHFDHSRRVKGTKPQKALSKKERIKSLRNSFLVTKPLNGKSIVIVDDVMTTGATVNSLATELKRAGAGSISVWVLARTPNYRFR
jgi:ComF family protein